MFKKTKWCFLFLGLCCFSAEAKTLYVDGSVGNDSTSHESNSVSNPWRTLGRAVWGSTNQASPNTSQAAQAGDIVLVKSGRYSAPGTNTRLTPAFQPANSGRQGNPITFKAVGVVNLTLDSGTTGPVFGAYRRSYIIWDGFISDESDHSVYQGEPFLATAWNSQYITFKNCIFKGQYLAADGRNHSAIRFEDADNCLVQKCLFDGFGGTGENHADIYLYSSQNIMIENNEHCNGLGAIWVKGNNSGSENERIVFRYNLVYNMSEAAVRFGPSSINGRVYQNIIYNSKNCLRLGTGAEGLGSGNIFANNTCDGTGTWLAAIRLSGNTYSGSFYNNIITNTTYGFVGSTADNNPGAHVFEHNVYFNFGSAWVGGTSRNYTYWTGTWGRDRSSPSSLVSNPLYESRAERDYRLQVGSPALNAGIDLLDLNRNSTTTDRIPAGAYVTGNETIGRTGGNDAPIPPGGNDAPMPPVGLTLGR